MKNNVKIKQFDQINSVSSIMIKLPHSINHIELILKYFKDLFNTNILLFTNYKIKIRIISEEYKNPINLKFLLSTKKFDIISIVNCISQFLGHYEQYDQECKITSIPTIVLTNIPEKFLEFFNNIQIKINNKFKELPLIIDYELYDNLNNFLNIKLQELQNIEIIDESDEQHPDKVLENIIKDLQLLNTSEQIFDTSEQNKIVVKQENLLQNIAINLFKEHNSKENIIVVKQENLLQNIAINLFKEHNSKENIIVNNKNSNKNNSIKTIKNNTLEKYTLELELELNKTIKNMKLINKLRANIRYYNKVKISNSDPPP
jgi:hypothetical protein